MRIIVLLGFVLVACRSMPAQLAPAARYVVTAEPIDVGIAPKLCIAVEPANPQGVWWWHPGDRGCSNRSTGPGVFRAEHVTVVEMRSATIEVRFRMQLILGPGSTRPDFTDVELVIQDASMHDVASGARVPVMRRSDLDVPAQPGVP
jgi:hypothetical protein